MDNTSVLSDSFNLIIIIVLLSLGIQMFSSFVITWLIFKHKNKEFFVRIFFAITIIPSIIYIIAWIQFFMNDGFIGEAFKEFLNVNLIEVITTNIVLYVFFISFFSAIPWIGLFVIMFLVFSKRIPKSVSDLAKMDNAYGMNLIKCIYFPILKPLLPIYILAVIVSISSIYHSIYYFNLLSGTSAGESYLNWTHSLATGQFTFNNNYSLLAIFLYLILGTGLFLFVKLITKKRRGFSE